MNPPSQLPVAGVEELKIIAILTPFPGSPSTVTVSFAGTQIKLRKNDPFIFLRIYIK